MRLVRILSCLCLLSIVSVSAASAASNWVASLNGANEAPTPVATPATGQFEGTLNDANNNMTFTLTYTGLVGTMTQSHIHRGAVGVAGPIVYWLANGNVPSPISGCTDPTPLDGTCGFVPADVTDLQAGNLYANLHSTFAPGGEIRGQITSAVPAQQSTWGKIKGLFR
jgi:hypothetical protein